MEIREGELQDRIWSKNTYRIDRIVEESGNRTLYYLKDGHLIEVS